MKKDSARMKNVSLLVICSLLLVTLLSGCSGREIKNIGSGGRTIICFGDSLTYGYGADRGQDYPSVLAKMLHRQVINAGVSGDTSTGGLSRIESDVLRKDPFLVIVEFGANDFLGKIPQKETAAHVAQMIDMIQEKGAMVALVDISAGLLFREYQAVYARIARAKGAIFIPGVFRGIITNPSLKSDFLHPNAEGYKIIAARIYQAVLPLLDKNNPKH